MKTLILKIDDPVKDIDKIRQAANCIDAGGLVVFPTETVYGIACKVEKKSLARLDEVKQRDIDKRYTLHIGDKNKLQDFVPTLTLPAKKLVKNAWPGPLTIVFQLNQADIQSLEKKLVPLETGRHGRPSGVNDALSLTGLGTETIKLLYNPLGDGLRRDNTIGIRCPENAVASALLNLCRFPVIAPSANVANSEPAANAKQALQQLDGLVDIVLDAGPCKYKKSSTVVKISPTGWQILREGVYSEKQIQKMLTVNILFVCTGNTCRSPMAEGFTKKLLAGKLKCDIDRLEQIGYKVTSAGTAAMNDIGASAEAVRLCNSKGVDITSHKSRRFTAEMLKEADYIFAMSAGHKNDIIHISPQAEQKCMLLEDAGDINDPIGASYEVYKTCGVTIEKAVNKRINELLK